MDKSSANKRSAFDAAISVLTRREHSVFELQKKLLHKGFPQAETERVIKQLLAQSYLSDARFAAMLVRSRIARGYGPVKLRYELQQHHISEVMIEQAFDEAQVDWYQLACDLYAKRFGQEPMADFADQQKRQRYLYQRGFDIQVINEIIRAF